MKLVAVTCRKPKPWPVSIMGEIIVGALICVITTTSNTHIGEGGGEELEGDGYLPNN